MTARVRLFVILAAIFMMCLVQRGLGIEPVVLDESGDPVSLSPVQLPGNL